jgi:hypothetical protein
MDRSGRAWRRWSCGGFGQSGSPSITVNCSLVLIGILDSVLSPVFWEPPDSDPIGDHPQGFEGEFVTQEPTPDGFEG